MKKILIWIFCGILLLVGVGCAGFHFILNQEAEEGMHLYYLSQEEDQLIQQHHKVTETESNALITELYALQCSLPERNKKELKLLLPENVVLLGFSRHDTLLTLDFSGEYREMSAEREILVRAGMVRLFTQVSGVKRVQFQVEGEPLTNEEGVELGSMTAGRFVENSGKEINSYLMTDMTLYFADSSGTRLVPEERSVYYNSNVPLEKVVVEQLAKGPRESGHEPVLPSEINILSVTIQDKICYVNLDDSFTNLMEISAGKLKPELAVYSLVNTLTRVCQVSKIQISVNGKTNVQIGDMELNTLFSQNPDLLLEETESVPEEVSQETEPPELSAEGEVE
ncbi:MAG: GerMN domain-containing protein [Lachnospiraceae bacterium]|nr:GerMN domain-containing protein [Lachnospiraceae bacterium]